MKNKKILALDQSTKVSGWAIFYGDQLQSFGHWTEKDEDISVRIHKLCQKIQEKIEAEDIDFIIIENIQLESKNKNNPLVNVATFQKLAWVQGAIMELCNEMYIPFTLLYPSEWRKACNFLKGNDVTRDSQKKIAQQWVLNNFNKKCTQDEADAICIGWGYLRQEPEEIIFD